MAERAFERANVQMSNDWKVVVFDHTFSPSLNGVCWTVVIFAAQITRSVI